MKSELASLELLMAIRNLRRRRVRSSLTTIGIIIGVVAIVGLGSLCDAVRTEVEKGLGGISVEQVETAKTLLVSIAGISLLVAGLGIMNTMLMSVMERRREIGILKAVGMNRRRIITAYIIESALIGAIGGASGCVLGYVVLKLVSLSTSASLPVSLEMLVFGFLFALVSSVMFGAYPSWKAATLKPVEALKYE